MRYYIGRQGSRLGPFTETEVREQLASGAVSSEDLVWHEGLAGWQPVHTLFPAATPPPAHPLPPAFTGGPVTHDEEPALAGRGRRLAATSLDHLLVFICMIPGLVKFFPLFVELVVRTAETNAQPDPKVIEQMLVDSFSSSLIPLLLLGVVQAILLCLRGQTVGKLLCKIRIVRTNGEPAGVIHAFLLRTVAMSFIYGIPLIGGFIALADPLLIFREDRRCLHDLLAGTTVIDI